MSLEIFCVLSVSLVAVWESGRRNRQQKYCSQTCNTTRTAFISWRKNGNLICKYLWLANDVHDKWVSNLVIVGQRRRLFLVSYAMPGVIGIHRMQQAPSISQSNKASKQRHGNRMTDCLDNELGDYLNIQIHIRNALRMLAQWGHTNYTLCDQGREQKNRTNLILSAISPRYQSTYHNLRFISIFHNLFHRNVINKIKN